MGLLSNSDWLKAASLGVEIAVAVFLGAFIGYKLDGWFHCAPWGMIAGVALGAAAGMWNAVKEAEKS